MNKQWTLAFGHTLQKQTIPQYYTHKDPHGKYNQLVVTETLKALGFKASQARRIAKSHTGTPRQRLNSICQALDKGKHKKVS